MEEGISQEILVIPVPRTCDGVFDDSVDYLVVEILEAGPIFLEMERFGLVGEGCGGLDDDEVVDIWSMCVETDFQPVQLRGEENQVIYLSWLSERLESVILTGCSPVVRRAVVLKSAFEV